MGIFNRTVPVDGLVFDHGLSKRQVGRLAAAEVAGHEDDTRVLLSCGINGVDPGPDEAFKVAIVACILHPDWEPCNRSLSSGLTELVISPSADFDQPAELKADVTQVLIDLAGRYVQLGEESHDPRFAHMAAQILAMVAQFGVFGKLDLASLPEPLLYRLGRLFPSGASLGSLGFSAQQLVQQFRSSGDPDGSG